MTQPRIAPLAPPYPSEVALDFERIMPPGVDPLLLFRVVGRNPRVLRRMRRGSLLDPGTIETRHREIVILRTTARCRSEYEWGVHVAFFARAARLTKDEIRATVHGSSEAPCWGDAESALIALVDALHDRGTVDDATWSRLRAHFEDEQLVELVMVAGLYHAVSFVTNAFAVPLESTAPRFPT